MPTTWVRRDDVLQRNALGEVVLLAPDGDEPIALAAPADRVWELLAAAHTEDQLVDELAAGIDPAVVRAAVTPLLLRLARQLLVICAETAS